MVDTSTITNEFGGILKRARLDRGLTREQLAEKIDISVRYLIAIENEGKKPSVDVLTRLIRELGISADVLFYPDDKGPNESPQLIRLIRSLGERDKKLIWAVAEAMNKDSNESP